jgi:hypothetical protein
MNEIAIQMIQDIDFGVRKLGFDSYEAGINWYAENFGYDVEKALNTKEYMAPTWYGSWGNIREFIAERKENEEYFWEIVACCGEGCESAVDFWDSLSGCFSEIVIEGNPWIEDKEDLDFDFTK